MTTQTKTTAKTICFAYFADGKFIGWYADTFGSIRTAPKLYSDSIEQVNIITENFRHKLSTIAVKSELAKIPTCEGLELLDNSINRDRTELSQYKEVELRIVECPIYDGKNPDFDSVKYAEENAEHKRLLQESGILNIPAPSKERTEALSAFLEKHPYPKCDNWIYADRAKVKEWAAKEPTEFIATIWV